MSIKNQNIQLLSPLDSFDANYDMMYYMWELNGYVKKIKEDNDYIDALLYEISNEEKKFEDKKEKVTYEKENILRIKMMKIIYYFNQLVEYVLDNNLLNYKPGIVK